MPVPDFQPTPEQQDAIDAFRTGRTVVIKALAGTGKTTTLALCARTSEYTGTYLAFNRAIAMDAGRAMPMTVKARTQHSVAYAAVKAMPGGRALLDRLNGPRIDPWRLASKMGVGHLVVTFEIAGKRKEKVLQPGYLAGHVMRAVTRFCQSADDVPGVQHFPNIDGIDPHDDEGRRTFANNRAVARELLPHLQDAWTDLTDPAGDLRFSHDVYVKLAQLNQAEIPGKFLLHDECQPPGTMVRTPTGDVPIESLVVGDRVVSYNQSNLRLNPSGNPLTDVKVRMHDGPMIEATVAGATTRYTPNHRCVVRIGDAFEGQALLYLMRRGHHFRVGVTRANHGRRVWAGIRGRLSEEGADAAWILAAFDHRADGLLAERAVVAEFGIPDVTFAAGHRPTIEHFTPERLDAWWAERGDLTDQAERLLRHYGRDIRYPFVTPARHLLVARATEVRAANLFPGMRMLDAAAFQAAGGSGRQWECWKPIEAIKATEYLGPVYSIEVDVNHTYVADGFVTHNCQDANPVTLAWLAAQQEKYGKQIVHVGDSYQQIYDWRGSVNAIDQIAGDGTEVTALTQSWRFGPRIAEAANAVLAQLGSDLKVQGNPAADGQLVVSPGGPNPRAVLCRTNAAAVQVVLSMQSRGLQPHLVGGADDIIWFANSAAKLQNGDRTNHPDLVCFDSWGEVLDYVANDPQGDELRMMVNLLEEYGIQIVLDALDGMIAEEHADVIVSTAHRAKGREWPVVRLAGDFGNEDTKAAEMPDPELRLLYVAATRAKAALDVHRCRPLLDLVVPPNDVTESALADAWGTTG